MKRPKNPFLFNSHSRLSLPSVSHSLQTLPLLFSFFATSPSLALCSRRKKFSGASSVVAVCPVILVSLVAPVCPLNEQLKGNFSPHSSLSYFNFIISERYFTTHISQFLYYYKLYLLIGNGILIRKYAILKIGCKSENWGLFENLGFRND